MGGDELPAWKKSFVILVGLLQIVIGILVILHTYYFDLSQFYSLNQWLSDTEDGQLLLLFSQVFIVLVGFIFLGTGLFSHRTSNQLVIFQDHTNRLMIDRSAVEQNLRLVLSKEYDIANIDIKLKLLKNKRQAKVKITGKLINETDLDSLEKDISKTIQTNLEQILNIGVKHLTLKLSPYSEGDKVTVI
ncbi:hypothetical protein FD20_GL001671 [Liquorilactobacillus uvarum DSM 19971]|uniref:Alkaline shock response membrane anchor protein AmaP n=1 Tax=Liquorilactobacillus uvarum DSM 19971 TaxID=1423812 RepID=A0A0R1Q7Y3_9LACO|nr:hypothetical protein FD20_GL001671 [Liquorilactobacillus uvarum DSM 19971]